LSELDVAGAAAAGAAGEFDPVEAGVADVSLLEELDPSVDLADDVVESDVPSVLAAEGLALP
jgi:hypothetical protein